MPRLGEHRTTALLFVAVILIFLVMGRFFPQELAIPLPGSAIRPVLLLEFAATPQHMVHIFGPVGDPARAGRIAGMNIGNAIDYLLMPAYGLMTFSFFRGVERVMGGSAWRWFAAMGLVAAVADAAENALMFRMVADMTNPLDEMALLPLPVWIKFGLLAVTCAGAAWAFVRMRRWILAALCIPAPLLLVPGMLDPYGLAPTSTMLIGLGWLAMGAHSVLEWRREAGRHS
jgi:hypothetical protein